MQRNQKKDPKQEALRRSATLNPHPEKVKDELFLQEGFFDRRDLIQVKYEMLRRVRVDGEPVSRAARAFGFSRPTFYQLQKVFQRSGWVGLLPAKKGPQRRHKLSAEVVGLLSERLELSPDLRVGELVGLVEQTFGIRVHPRSIQRALLARSKKGP